MEAADIDGENTEFDAVCTSGGPQSTHARPDSNPGEIRHCSSAPAGQKIDETQKDDRRQQESYFVE